MVVLCIIRGQFDEGNNITLFKEFPQKLFVNYTRKNNNFAVEKIDVIQIFKINIIDKGKQTLYASRHDTLRRSQHHLCGILSKMHNLNLTIFIYTSFYIFFDATLEF